MAKVKYIAKITVFGAEDMTLIGRKEVGAWLHKEADDLIRIGHNYSKKFEARFLRNQFEVPAACLHKQTCGERRKKMTWNKFCRVSAIIGTLLLIFWVLMWICGCPQKTSKSVEPNLTPVTDKAKVEMYKIDKTMELKAAKYDQVTEWSRLLSGWFAIGLAIGLFIIAGGKSVGIPSASEIGAIVLISCSGGLIVCLANNYFPMWIALSCFMLLIVVAGCALWYYIPKYLLHKTAFTKVVKGNENFKTLVIDPMNAALPAVEVFLAAQTEAQKNSPQTTQLVSQIRNSK